MNSSTYPENVLASLHQLIALRNIATGAFNKSYKKSSALMAGAYSSPFRGRGIDFSEVRLYQPGDDIRTIDWRVTARTGKTHTKLYVEERERPVIFAVDCGANMQFGTQGSFKSVVAAKVAAILAWAAGRHGDRVGGILFAGNEHEEVKPAGSKRGILKLLHKLVDWNQNQLQSQNYAATNDLYDLALRLKRIAKPGSMVYLISDFVALGEKEIVLLSYVAKHCDLVLIHVYDVIEKNAPPVGQYRVSDGKQEGIINVDRQTFPAKVKKEFEMNLQKLEKLRLSFGIHVFSICTTDDVPQTLRDNLTHKMLKTL